MLRNDWPVCEHGIRPAGRPDSCFYCGAAKGTQHRSGCVVRHRTVVVRTIIEHVVAVPEDWDQSLIEFTEGSSCSDNRIDDIIDMVERMDAEGKCTCGMITVEYVREATAEDESSCETYVDRQPT